MLSAFLLSCGDEVNVTTNLPDEVTIKEEDVGQIIGKVIWDYDGDGVYETIDGIQVWSYQGKTQISVIHTEASGLYTFIEMPIGSYTITAKKGTSERGGIYTQNWQNKVGVVVTKGDVVQAEDIILQKVNEYTWP